MKLLLTSAVIALAAIVASAVPAPKNPHPHQAFRQAHDEMRATLKIGEFARRVKQDLADHHAIHTAQGVEVPKKLVLGESIQATSRGFNAQVKRSERAKKLTLDTSAACVSLSTTANLALYAGCFLADIPPIMSQQMTEAAATSAISTFKYGLCFNATQLVMANKTCFPSDTVILASIIHSAWTDYEMDSNGVATTRWCAHTWANLNRQMGFFAPRGCTNFTANECTAAAPVCRLRPTDYVGDVNDYSGSVSTISTTSPCEENHDTSANAKLCTGCMATWLNKWKGLNTTNEIAQGFTILNGMHCKTTLPSGEKCFPVVQTAMDAAKGEPFHSESAATAFCGSNTSYSCFKRIYRMFMATVRTSMQNNLKVCLKGYFPAGVPADTALSHPCLSGYYGGIAYVKLLSNVLKLGCVKNAAGKHCNQLREAIARNSDKCYETAQTGAILKKYLNVTVACTSACQTSLGDAVSNMGCCAGSIQEALSGALYHFTQRDFPRGVMKAGGGFWTGPTIPAVTQLPTSAPLTLATNEVETVAASGDFLANIGATCSVTNLYDNLRVKCKPTGVKVSKKLKLRIVFSTLTADQKSNIQAALKTDMANNLGLSEDEIVNDALVEDTTVQIESTTSTSTQRRFIAQDGESTSSGSQYTFDIETEDEESGTTASNSFDSMESSGSFTLTETEDETGETVDSGESATAEDETDSGDSGASSVFVLLSLAVSAILAAIA